MRQKIGNIGFTSYGSEQDLKILIKGLIPQILEHFVDDGELQYPLPAASDPDAHFTITTNKVGKDGKLLSVGKLVLKPTAPANMPGYMKKDFMSHYFMKYTEQQKLIWRYEAHRILLLHLTEGGDRKPMQEADRVLKAVMGKSIDTSSKANHQRSMWDNLCDPAARGVFMNPNRFLPQQRPNTPLHGSDENATFSAKITKPYSGSELDTIIHKGLLTGLYSTKGSTLNIGNLTFQDVTVADNLKRLLAMSFEVSSTVVDLGSESGTYLEHFLSSLFGDDLSKTFKLGDKELVLKKRISSIRISGIHSLVDWFNDNGDFDPTSEAKIHVNTLTVRKSNGRLPFTYYSGIHIEGVDETFVAITTDKGVNVFKYSLVKKTKSKKAKK